MFLFVFVVLVLFQLYSKTALSSQSHFQDVHYEGIYKPLLFHRRRSGKPLLNIRISADFREIKQLCTFMMPFLYDWDFIFLSVVTVGARHRFYDLTEIKFLI